MAREIYGATGGDFIAALVASGGYDHYVRASATFDVFTTRTGSTQHTSLLTMAGSAIAAVTPDASGGVRFQGQDTYRGSYWLQDQANPSLPRWRMDPVGMAERLVAVETSGAALSDGDKGAIVITTGVWALDAGSVGTAAIADNAVTLAKMADIATARILGRTTAATGDPEALTAAQVWTLLGAIALTAIPAGIPFYVKKVAGVWPARPNNDATRLTFFVGPAPAPTIITSGTAGMYEGDIHILAP